MIQFIENHFVESYYPTIESTFSKTINYKGTDYDCDIIDTAGQVRVFRSARPVLPIDCTLQDEYTILNSKHAIGIHGFVLVYSVASRKSFDMVQVVYEKIINFCGLNEIPCVIVGSKSDLANRCVRGSAQLSCMTASSSAFPAVNSTPHPRPRQVPPQEGEKLAQEKHAAWVETSAKTNSNVNRVFELCLEQIEKSLPSSKAEPPASKCTIQ